MTVSTMDSKFPAAASTSASNRSFDSSFPPLSPGSCWARACWCFPALRRQLLDQDQFSRCSLSWCYLYRLPELLPRWRHGLRVLVVSRLSFEFPSERCQAGWRDIGSSSASASVFPLWWLGASYLMAVIGGPKRMIVIVGILLLIPLFTSNYRRALRGVLRCLETPHRGPPGPPGDEDLLVELAPHRTGKAP